jgi:hypothetical protein
VNLVDPTGEISPIIWISATLSTAALLYHGLKYIMDIKDASQKVEKARELEKKINEAQDYDEDLYQQYIDKMSEGLEDLKDAAMDAAQMPCTSGGGRP